MNFLWGGLGLLALCAVTLSRRQEEAKLADGKLGDRGEHKKRYKGKIGFEVGGVVISPKKMLNGIWIVGPPEVGKSSTLYIYNLLRKEFPLSSKIITDPKGEIYETTKKFRDSLGEECYQFEPLNPNSEFKINFLDFCEDENKVVKLAHSILVEEGNSNDITWQEMALPLWSGVLVWAYNQPPGLNNIPSAINLLNTNNFQTIEKELSKYKKSNELFNEFKSYMGAEKQLSGILGTLRSKIHIYTDSSIQANLKESTFNPMEFKKRYMNVYIKYKIGDINYLKQFLKIFYGQLFYNLCDDVKEKLIVFMLDEAQNVGKIPDFYHYCAYARNSNISIIAGTQDMSALMDIYGRFQTNSITSSLQTLIAFPRIKDVEALNAIEKWCGETEIITTENNQEKRYKKPLFSSDSIRTLKNDEVILVIENCNPIVVKLKSWHTCKELVKNMDGIKFGEVKWL